MECFGCKDNCQGGHRINGGITVSCRYCGDYRLSNAAEQAIEAGSLRISNRFRFRSLVTAKRNLDFRERYPLITKLDL